MTLHQLITSHSWLSIKTLFLTLYPDQEEGIEGYQQVFETLLQMEPVPDSMRIVLRQHTKEDDDDDWVDVSGYNNEVDDNGAPISFALEFTRWNEWLGMEIAAETLREFSELEILSHCLFDMTFISYNEDEIQDEIGKIEARTDELKRMTEEERKQNTMTLDELKKKLGFNGDDSDIPEN